MVAGRVLGQKNQVVRSHLWARTALEPALWCNIHFAADNGLDSVLLRRLIELDNAVHRAVIGDSQRIHAQLFGAWHEFLDLAHAVKERILRMDVQVRERSRRQVQTSQS